MCVYIYIYIYIYMCECVCVCVSESLWGSWRFRVSGFGFRTCGKLMVLGFTKLFLPDVLPKP